MEIIIKWSHRNQYNMQNWSHVNMKTKRSMVYLLNEITIKEEKCLEGEIKKLEDVNKTLTKRILICERDKEKIQNELGNALKAKRALDKSVNLLREELQD